MKIIRYKMSRKTVENGMQPIIWKLLSFSKRKEPSLLAIRAKQMLNQILKRRKSPNQLDSR